MSEWLIDTIYRKDLIKFISKKFNPIKDSYEILIIGNEDTRKRCFIEEFGSIDIDGFNLLNFALCKENTCIEYLFLIKDSTFYLYHVRNNIKSPYYKD